MAILVVDDDRELVDLLGYVFARAGLQTAPAHDPQEARRQFSAHPIELIILDVNLGQSDGFGLLRELREQTDLPIIMLSGRDSEDDVVRGLELGADDYITKPFSHRELVARVQAALRRRGPGPARGPGPRMLRAGALIMDVVEHTVRCAGRSVALTATEFRLLEHFLRNPGRAIAATELLQEVWGYQNPLGAAAVVRVAIHRLRRKLGDDAAHPQLLITIPGVGFRLDATPAEPPTAGVSDQ